MEQTCPKCRAQNRPMSRFCRKCGMTLGATMLQGKTVVMAPMSSPAPVPPPADSTLTGAVHNTQNAGLIPTAPALFGDDRASRLELTIFAQDISGSMNWPYDERYTKLQAGQRAVMSMVLEKGRLDPDDQIGLVAFDDKAKKILDLCPIVSHKHQILEAIQSLGIEGGTDINEGLKLAHEMFDWARPDVVRRIVLLTDGQGGHPLPTAEDLKSRGVVIDVRGVGDSPQNVDEKLLRKVASVVEGEVRYRFIKDSRALVDDYTRLANKTAVSA